MWLSRRLGAFLAVAGGILSGCATSPDMAGGPRSVVLVQSASGETVSTTYWRPGEGYDRAALREVTELFRDRRSGDVTPVDPHLLDYLVDLRDRLGVAPDTPVLLTSGFRSQATNAALARSNPNVADHSYHMRGQAMDFRIPGVAPQRIAEAAAELHRGGYAAYPHTGHVHIDTGPYRTWVPKDGEPRPRDILEARARSSQTPGRMAGRTPPRETRVAEAAPPSAPPPAPPKPEGISEADRARLRMVLVNLAAQGGPSR